MGFGFALFAGIAPDVIRGSAREAESLGYDSFWVNHPGPVDGLASLAHAEQQPVERQGLRLDALDDSQMNRPGGHEICHDPGNTIGV